MFSKTYWAPSFFSCSVRSTGHACWYFSVTLLAGEPAQRTGPGQATSPDVKVCLNEDGTANHTRLLRNYKWSASIRFFSDLEMRWLEYCRPNSYYSLQMFIGPTFVFLGYTDLELTMTFNMQGRCTVLFLNIWKSLYKTEQWSLQDVVTNILNQSPKARILLLTVHKKYHLFYTFYIRQFIWHYMENCSLNFF